MNTVPFLIEFLLSETLTFWYTLKWSSDKQEERNQTSPVTSLFERKRLVCILSCLYIPKSWSLTPFRSDPIFLLFTKT